MCPTSLSHPFTISLGDVPSLHGYGKSCNTRGPDQPFANSHHHAEELTVESARCWSLHACAQSPDPRPGFARLGNALRCSSVASTPGGGSGLRKAPLQEQITGKCSVTPNGRIWASTLGTWRGPLISPLTGSQYLHNAGSSWLLQIKKWAYYKRTSSDTLLTGNADPSVLRGHLCRQTERE